MYDIVADLVERNSFSQRTYVDQLQIIKYGRPQPELMGLISITKDKDRAYTRKFCSSTYQKFDWLTGSFELNKLFCWPCLLFSTENGPWNHAGFNNLSYVLTACEKHQISNTHIIAQTQLHIFKGIEVDDLLNKEKTETITLHNKEVNQNRIALKRLIDIAIFVGGQVSGNCEMNQSNISNNNFIEQLKFLASYDAILASYLKFTNLFDYKSPAIYNDLIEASSNVIKDIILSEINKTNFIAMSLHETTELMNKSQLATVLRYVDEKGNCQERFLHFTDISAYRSAEGVFFRLINKVISDYDCAKKLIAFTFDGATVRSEHMLNLLNLVKDRYPRALFVHGNCERLDFVLLKSTIFREECQRFFITLDGVRKFFITTNRIKALNIFMETNFPEIQHQFLWNFTTDIIKNLNIYRRYLIEFFQSIEDKAGDWSSEEVCAALGFINFLTKFDTKFLLIVFNTMFDKGKILFEAIEDRNADITTLAAKVDEFLVELQFIKEAKFQDIWAKVTTNDNELNDTIIKVEPDEPNPKRIKTRDDDFKYMYIFNEIVDTVLAQVKQRLQSAKYYSLFLLLDSKYFDFYRMNFPDKIIHSFQELYLSHFDISRLKSELKILYSFDEFQNKSVKEIYNYMKLFNLEQMYKETFKLLQLYLTFPILNISDDRSFSVLKRINNYLQVTKGEILSDNSALLCIESDILKNIKNVCDEEFYDKITTNFVAIGNRSEFTYM